MLNPYFGWIVIPDSYLNFLHNYNYETVIMFSKILNLKIVPNSEFDPTQTKKNDIVFLFSVPSNNCNNSFAKNCKGTVFYWMDDCQWPAKDIYYQIKDILIRADFVFYVSKSIFSDLWLSFCSKAYWFPCFVHDDFLLPYNESPDVNCLLFGHCSKTWYPIRNKVKTEGPYVLKDKLKIIEHPGYQPKNLFYSGKSLAKVINQSYCCLTDSGIAANTLIFTNADTEKFSIKEIELLVPGILEKSKNYGHVLKKYFEIPACGSLLIADANTPEMIELGFIPNVNYVVVDKNNAIDVIQTCLLNPEKYDTMRKSAYEMIHKNHTIRNRIEYAVDIFKKEGII